MTDGLALSALDWWAEAGVDTIVDDTPFDWLATAAPVAHAPSASVTPPAASTALPDNLTEYRRWLIAEAPIPGAPSTRIDASGDASSGTMVIVDMPEAADLTSGAILSGDAGTLFDRMLTAMKLERGAIYMAPFSLARPATGRLSESDCTTLAPLIRHHIVVAAPKRLLILGDAPARVLLGKPLAQARSETHVLAIAGTDIPTIASFHPRFVLERPDFRKPAWADLQMFMAL